MLNVAFDSGAEGSSTIPPAGGLPATCADTEALFRRALAGLYMTYQPIVRLNDGSVFGWEALLRTQEPALASPLVFLEVAERLGRIATLGRAIRATVARTVKRTPGVMFFVNLHPDDLLDEDLFDPASPLATLAPEVVLELSERKPVEEQPELHDRVGRLRRLGFRLAIDDLGAGYASLTSFASVEPEFVKLDRTLIVGIEQEPVRRRLVASVIEVSHDMRAAVVAEGIETPAQRETAARLGCDLMQGFLFRSPDQLAREERFALAGGA